MTSSRERRQARAVTGVDVAKAAGVSQSVVSLVFSGRAGSRVSASTATRVIDEARKLGYSPNSAAAALRTGRTSSLALAVPVVTQPYFAAVLHSAEKRARQLGFSVVLIASREDPEWMPRLVDMLRGGQLAGAIVYGPTPAEAASLAGSGVRVVACELYSDELPSVDLDLARGVHEAAQHLIELGHRDVAYLGTDYPHVTYDIRYESFVRSMSELGGRVTQVIRSPAADFASAVHNARRLLDDRLPGTTAVMCDDDLLAPAVMRAANLAGLSVPRDMSVVGVGGLTIAEMLTPPLTTVAISADDVGHFAVEELVKAITGGQPESRIVGTSLTIRGSVAFGPTRVEGSSLSGD